jgi:hypothetical protein
VQDLGRRASRQQATTRAQQCPMLDIGIDGTACLVPQLEVLPRRSLIADEPRAAAFHAMWARSMSVRSST